MNLLYYGDNLNILREHIPDASVDLVYLDPPFNSNRSYNVLFKESTGQSADAQITAFDDTWHWGPSSEEALSEINQRANPVTVEIVNAIVSSVKRNDVAAYLVIMTVRLIELHRVLKPTGSIYLHCDPTASHYLKVVMDTIFGPENFRNEITWKRTSAHSNVGKRYAVVQDRLLFYTRSSDWTWNQPFLPYSSAYLESHYSQVDPLTQRRFTTRDLTASMQRASKGQLYEWHGFRPGSSRCWAYTKEKMEQFEADGLLVYSSRGMPRLKLYLDEMKGTPCDDTWLDIPAINSQAAERLGYPTQKPLALLERIILASSNPGDVVLDAFCGCGTAVIAAQKHGRQWIGIDITHLAVGLMRSRLRETFVPEPEYRVVGVPVDVASAAALKEQDTHEFEHWALGLIGARSSHGGKKGADQGVDGVLFFQDTAKGKAKKIVVQVKSGHVQRNVIGDLRNSMRRDKAVMAFLITLEPASKPMQLEAIAAGYYDSPGWGRHYERVQIRTIEELLAGQGFDYPPANMTFNKAVRESAPKGTQGELL